MLYEVIFHGLCYDSWHGLHKFSLFIILIIFETCVEYICVIGEWFVNHYSYSIGQLVTIELDYEGFSYTYIVLKQGNIHHS